MEVTGRSRRKRGMEGEREASRDLGGAGKGEALGKREVGMVGQRTAAACPHRHHPGEGWGRSQDLSTGSSLPMAGDSEIV